MFALAFAENAASRRVLEKAAFTLVDERMHRDRLHACYQSESGSRFMGWMRRMPWWAALLCVVGVICLALAVSVREGASAEHPIVDEFGERGQQSLRHFQVAGEVSVIQHG